MKKNIYLILVIGLITVLNTSCSRFYGMKKPLAQPVEHTVQRPTPAKMNPTEAPAINETSILSSAATSTPRQPSPYIEMEATQPANDVYATSTIEPALSEQDLKQTNISQAEKPLATPLAEEAGDRKMDGFAITGFVTSLVGLFVFGYILGGIAVVFSAIGLARTIKRKDELKGKGLAISGLVIGIVDIVLLAILSAVYL